MLYKIYFKINCPFDPFGTLSPQDSEIRCAVRPGAEPVFCLPSYCNHCNRTNLDQCKKCISALYLMFQQGCIPFNLDAAHHVQTLPVPIRPSLELPSK